MTAAHQNTMSSTPQGPSPTVRPLVTDAPDPNEKRLRDAFEILHRYNADLLAIETFIIRHLVELEGLRWSVTIDTCYSNKSGLVFYYYPPGDTLHSPDAPTPEDTARRFPGDWEIKDGYEGAKNAEAKREGILLRIIGFLPRPSPKPPGAGQTVTF